MHYSNILPSLFIRLNFAENLNLFPQFYESRTTIPKLSIFSHKLTKKHKTTSLPTHILTHNSTHNYYTQKDWARQEHCAKKENKMFDLKLEILLMGNWSKLSFHINRKLNFCV